MTEVRPEIPNEMQQKYEEIIALTDQYSCEFLNDEYADLARIMTATLCSRRPCLVAKGKTGAWACAIIHSVGMANFLFDKNNLPYVSAADLYKHFGISSSSGSKKSKAIRDLLDIYPLCEEWRLPSLKHLHFNPLWQLFDVKVMLEPMRD